MPKIDIVQGDCLVVLPKLEAESFHAVICDPPYHLTTGKKGGTGAASLNVNSPAGRARISTGFMGQAWDGGDVAFQPETWAAVYRVLKPGAHLLAFGGTRTYHRLACAIEDAGFEIRDTIMWLYGVGFPKSLDVSKAIDKRSDWSAIRELQRVIRDCRMASGKTLRQVGEECEEPWWYRGGFLFFETGLSIPTQDQWLKLKACLDIGDEWDGAFKAANREIIEERTMTQGGGTSLQLRMGERREVRADITAPATDAAREWQGWGTALKPACELICVARKPLGTGDINVRRNVESEIRSRGYTGEIMWSDEPVVSAKSPKTLKDSSRTPSSAETFAASVVVPPTTSTEPRMSISSGEITVDGMQSTDRSTSTLVSSDTMNSASKSCVTMDASAHVAENVSGISSPSIISKAAEANTGRRSAAKSMPISEREDSRLDTESFAGIATGLTGSLERVLIKREGGSFVWPTNLPTFILSKPLNVAANVLRHGTGALNIDASRVGATKRVPASVSRHPRGSLNSDAWGYNTQDPSTCSGHDPNIGRWPANVVHSGSPEVLEAFERFGSSESVASSGRNGRDDGSIFAFGRTDDQVRGHTDNGTVARFFFCAKADASERADSEHPTVKPLALLKWLVTLVTPPGGRVLDPFAGTGTTLAACDHLGFDALGIELSPQYVEDAKRKIERLRARRFIGSDITPQQGDPAQMRLFE